MIYTVYINDLWNGFIGISDIKGKTNVEKCMYI